VAHDGGMLAVPAGRGSPRCTAAFGISLAASSKRDRDVIRRSVACQRWRCCNMTIDSKIRLLVRKEKSVLPTTRSTRASHSGKRRLETPRNRSR
jgi:hypothetical protein